MQTELMFSLEDSPASPTPSQGSARARPTSATCGPKCLEQLERFDHVGSWAKTFMGLLIGMEDWSSTRCSLTWKLRATKRSRFYCQLQASARHTKGTGCSLLLTPATTMRVEPPESMRARAERKGYKNGTKYNSLASQVLYGTGFLPTPQAGDEKGHNTNILASVDRHKTSKGQNKQIQLRDLAPLGMLPTPTARDFKGGRSTEQIEANGRTEGKTLSDHFALPGTTSQLNPPFVLEMMGFSPDWTAVPFLVPGAARQLWVPATR